LLNSRHCPSLPSLLLLNVIASGTPIFTVIASETPLLTVIASGTQCNEAICLIEGQIAWVALPLSLLKPRNDVLNGLRNDGQEWALQ